MFDGHTYPGGAWRIHMLRRLMGDEVFWSGVQTYIERFSKKTVQTSDFQNCLEEASGLNLNRFFDEWFLSRGYPKLKGQYEFADNTVKISMTQTQVDEANQVPLFGFSLEIEVTSDSGSVYNGIMTFDQLKTMTAVIELPKGEKPTQLRIDPEYKVLFTLEMPSVDRDILIETAKNAKDVINRIWAYSELITSGSRPALKAVHESILKEKHHGVRIYSKYYNVNNNCSVLIIFF
jgi:aminopeptidase N